MKTRQFWTKQAVVTAIVGTVIATGFATNLSASSLTVDEITDWGTTPNEQISADIPYLGYDGGGILAGINTLSVYNGTTTTVMNGFCVDPFHWSASGPTAGYSLVAMTAGPKAPGTLSAATALDIEELWGEFYSPTMSSANAAGLQIAIWELVSANAIANNGLPPSDAFCLTQTCDYGAAADIATLADYSGPVADLGILTGPGQDFVVQVSTPDGGATFLMLAISMAALLVAAPAALKQRQLQPVSVRR